MEEKKEASGGHYKFGLFYCEDNNKRFIVRNPHDRYSLNHANKWAYVIDSIFIIVVILKILAISGVIK